MCSFSGATCTSRVRQNADYVPYAKIRFDLKAGSTSESRQPHSQLQWRFRDQSLCKYSTRQGHRAVLITGESIGVQNCRERQ